MAEPNVSGGCACQVQGRLAWQTRCCTLLIARCRFSGFEAVDTRQSDVLRPQHYFLRVKDSIVLATVICKHLHNVQP